MIQAAKIRETRFATTGLSAGVTISRLNYLNKTNKKYFSSTLNLLAKGTKRKASEAELEDKEQQVKKQNIESNSDKQEQEQETIQASSVDTQLNSNNLTDASNESSQDDISSVSYNSADFSEEESNIPLNETAAFKEGQGKEEVRLHKDWTIINTGERSTSESRWITKYRLPTEEKERDLLIEKTHENLSINHQNYLAGKLESKKGFIRDLQFEKDLEDASPEASSENESDDNGDSSSGSAPHLASTGSDSLTSSGSPKAISENDDNGDSSSGSVPGLSSDTDSGSSSGSPKARSENDDNDNSSSGSISGPSSPGSDSGPSSGSPEASSNARSNIGYYIGNCLCCIADAISRVIENTNIFF